MIKSKKIPRVQEKKQILSRFKAASIVAILGPRQCGKTTIAKDAIGKTIFFDLENPRDLTKLDNPQMALEGLKGKIVIDEIQRRPELFPLLRYLVDSNSKQKYLILGSASRELIKQSSETLAGRISYYELCPFSIDEVGSNNIKKLWIRGGFPPSFLAKTDQNSYQWREDYIQSFLERDIPALGISIPSTKLRRFWTMLSYYHGQIINYSELAGSFGISDKTVSHYIQILEGTFMVRILQPWHANIGKRIVKSPKVYVRDSGIFHTLLSINSEKDLHNNPKLGASWEGFVIEQVCRVLKRKNITPYFWAVHSGAELDLFWQEKNKNYGIEIKYSDAPKITNSMKSALIDLKLDHLWVIYPGRDEYKLQKEITVLPIDKFL
jgi:uncharacterized protein